MLLHFNPNPNSSRYSLGTRQIFKLLQRNSEEWRAAIESIEKYRFEVYRYIVQMFSYVVHDFFLL